VGATEIEWCDVSWNPLAGCRKASPGCANCYAERMARRLAGMARADLAAGRRLRGKRKYLEVLDGDGRWNGKVVLDEQALDEPLRWKRPRRVFVCSMSDLFQPAAEPFLERIALRMLELTRHTFLVLTKRPERIQPWRPGKMREECAHIWMGCSVEDQKHADDRWKAMQRVHSDGWRTFVSYEPALGPVDWAFWEFLDWMVAGGESGPRARPAHPVWFRAARDWCQANRVPFFFKQWGGFNKKANGRLLDGRTWDELPGLKQRGNEATRQRGSEAMRQRGSEATRQRGNEADNLKATGGCQRADFGKTTDDQERAEGIETTDGQERAGTL
jgi:protein gp37